MNSLARKSGFAIIVDETIGKGGTGDPHHLSLDLSVESLPLPIARVFCYPAPIDLREVFQCRRALVGGSYYDEPDEGVQREMQCYGWQVR
jgi:hypothetical protein